METSNSIPLNIRQSLSAGLSVGATLENSSKGATSENQAVNEGGAATYSVLGVPDGFLQININGTVYYLAFWS